MSYSDDDDDIIDYPIKSKTYNTHVDQKTFNKSDVKYIGIYDDAKFKDPNYKGEYYQVDETKEKSVVNNIENSSKKLRKGIPPSTTQKTTTQKTKIKTEPLSEQSRESKEEQEIEEEEGELSGPSAIDILFSSPQLQPSFTKRKRGYGKQKSKKLKNMPSIDDIVVDQYIDPTVLAFIMLVGTHAGVNYETLFNKNLKAIIYPTIKRLRKSKPNKKIKGDTSIPRLTPETPTTPTRNTIINKGKKLTFVKDEEDENVNSTPLGVEQLKQSKKLPKPEPIKIKSMKQDDESDSDEDDDESESDDESLLLPPVRIFSTVEEVSIKVHAWCLSSFTTIISQNPLFAPKNIINGDNYMTIVLSSEKTLVSYFAQLVALDIQKNKATSGIYIPLQINYATINDAIIAKQRRVLEFAWNSGSGGYVRIADDDNTNKFNINLPPVNNIGSNYQGYDDILNQYRNL